MAIHNLGSINIDHAYTVSRIPGPGETMASRTYQRGLGGKGANQSIAIARAGGFVRHIGAVGHDATFARDELADANVDVTNVLTIGEATGHAIIYVDDAGENTIVIHGGANRALTLEMVDNALQAARSGDWLLAQNETNLVRETVTRARECGLNIAYAAAPFEAEIAANLISHVDLLAVNAIEADQLAEHLNIPVDDLPVSRLLVTMGAAGARYKDHDAIHEMPAFPVDPVDTTGAGDTFLGYFLAALDNGAAPLDAMKRAAAAAALQVTRPGAATAIPDGEEVDAFLSDAR